MSAFNIAPVHTCGGALGCIRCITDTREDEHRKAEQRIAALVEALNQADLANRLCDGSICNIKTCELHRTGRIAREALANEQKQKAGGTGE